jgi:hypothetical protein
LRRWVDPAAAFPVRVLAQAPSASRTVAVSSSSATGSEARSAQAGQRWHVERTNAWHNSFTRLQRCYERNEDRHPSQLAGCFRAVSTGPAGETFTMCHARVPRVIAALHLSKLRKIFRRS